MAANCESSVLLEELSRFVPFFDAVSLICALCLGTMIRCVSFDIFHASFRLLLLMACAASLLVAVPMALFEFTITRATLPLMRCVAMTAQSRLCCSTLSLYLCTAALFLPIDHFGAAALTALSAFGIL
jgi:hypothetical protein